MHDPTTPRTISRATLGLGAVAMLLLAVGCTSAQAHEAAPTTSRPVASTTIATTTTDPPRPSDPPVTDPPVTEAPVTEPPDTDPPETEPPIITIDATPNTVQTPLLTVPTANLTNAFFSLIDRNDAVSVSVIRDHQLIFDHAAGVGTSGQTVTSDTPLVLASVSKLVTALTVARLVEDGKIELDAPVPWNSMFLNPDPAWNTVTVRELLAHTSGMPIARASWLNTPGSCATPLAEAIAQPPTTSRGTWRYSNGNYCALGLLIESVTNGSRAVAADKLVFDPAGVTGPHLTTDGLLPGDGPYAEGVARLERLGGAGTWLASSNDIAAMLDAVTVDDMTTLQWPGIITDQYGWGHTGTIDGAKACAWVIEGGRTVVVAIVAGNRPSTGGRVCDAIVPALAADLGIWADKPIRSPD